MLPLDPHTETDRLASKLFKHFCQCLQQMQLEDIALGGNLTQGLKKLGIQYDKSAISATKLSLNQYYRLLETVAPNLQETGFFLYLGNAFDISDAGILGYASISVENLGQSWELTSQRNLLYPHPINGQRRIENQQVIIELPLPAHTPVDQRYLQEEWLATTWKWMCQRLPEISDNRELQLKLNYPAPGYKKVYEDIFPGKVLFNQPATTLSFPEAWYAMRFPSANPATAQLCQQQCQFILAQLDSQTDLVDQVRRMLLLSPQRQFPTLQQVAEQFHLPAHTVHRRLKKAGVSYRHIVNEVKMNLARDYLENTALPLQEVSYLLGYDYSPNFFRAFKKWFGITADRCRQQAEERNESSDGYGR